MRQSVLALLALGVSLVASARAQTTIHVDAVHGSDAHGDGSVSSPFRSLTHAIAVSTVPYEIQLAPGVYGPSTESFPIHVPAGVAIRGSGAGGVTIANSSGDPGYLLEIQDAAGGGTVEFSDLTILPNGILNHGVRLRILDPATGGVTLSFVRCWLESGNSFARLIHVEAAPFAGLATVALRDSILSTMGDGIVIHVTGLSGQAALEMLRSAVQAQKDAVRVDVSRGTFFGRVERSILTLAHRGLASHSTSGGKAFWTVRHSMLAYLGIPCVFSPGPVPPNTGAIVDTGPTAAGNVRHVLGHNVFLLNHGPTVDSCDGSSGWWHFADDLPTYRAPDYELESNCFDQPSVAQGTNFVGTGMWAFAELPWKYQAIGTWNVRILEHSVLRDAAGPSWHPHDFEGDPLYGPCFDGLPDVGVDEYRNGTVYLLPGLRVGHTSKLGVVGRGLMGAETHTFGVVLVGAPASQAECPIGLGLLGAVHVATVIVNTPTHDSGHGSTSLAVPANPSFAGLTVGFQALLATTDGASVVFDWSRVKSERIRL